MQSFRITYQDWKPDEQKLREALCTLGNGYFGTRGAAEELPNNDFNYPGTYLAGGYNRAKTKISGRTIENEDFVNFPNWLCLSFKHKEGKWLNLERVKVLEYEQRLEMKKGLLEREFTIEDEAGRQTHLKSTRFVSMADKHLAGIQWQLTPRNWSGEIRIKSALDGRVQNLNVARYRDLENQHLDQLGSEKINGNSILLTVQTRQSKIIMSQAARTHVYYGNEPIEEKPKTSNQEGYIKQSFGFPAKEGQTYQIEKIVAIFTSRDRATSEPSLEARKEIERTGRFSEILGRHEQAMQRLWPCADLGTIGSREVQKLARLHIFHILQTVSFNSIGLDAGVPARGLHGEAYRGHIFWDELFIFPFLNLRFPEITRTLLMYRYYRLGEARHAAREKGLKGAMFPWQSGSNGREESQEIHLNPESGNWLPDETHLQRHVNAAIAYNIWHYYLASQDRQFLSFFGAEIFLNIALFWASMAKFNKNRGRYEIHGIVGPDEYHTSYPGSNETGLKNNAYTNVMAAWVLQKALDILELIEKSRKKELMKLLRIDAGELLLWKKISKKMYIPFIDEDIISQFEGYENLREFPWEEYQEKYENIQRLDRILEKEGDSPNNYKASKQADVLMLFYLFSQAELKKIFSTLGYEFNELKLARNINYYRERTSHGSTLSRLVFSWVLSRYDEKESWENFETLIISDFKDIQGGTTPEGIHLGAMAGSLDLIQRSFLGLETGDQALWIKPHLPKNIKKIAMRVKYRNHWLFITLDHKKIKISFEEGWSNKVNIGVIDKIHEFRHGEVREFQLTSSKNSLKQLPVKN